MPSPRSSADILFIMDPRLASHLRYNPSVWRTDDSSSMRPLSSLSPSRDVVAATSDYTPTSELGMSLTSHTSTEAPDLRRVRTDLSKGLS